MAIGIIGLVLMALAPAVMGSEQTPVRTEPSSSGLVAGRVIDSATGAPVGAVVVAMYLDGNPALPSKVLTLADGRFLFRGVPKGTYRLYADKPGYISGAFGRLAPDGATLTMEVGAGQWLLNRELVIWKQSVMTGIVRDDAGIPVAGAIVRAVSLRPDGRKPGGTRYLVWPGTQISDDRGAFRFVLPPGRYTALVSSPYAPGAEGAPGIIPTFHPSSVDPSLATTYDISPGEVQANVDVKLLARKMSRVAGRVVSTAPVPKGTEVRLVAAYADLMSNDRDVEVALSTVTPEGNFAFTAMPEGDYLIRLTAPPGAQGVWASQAITVSAEPKETDVFADTGRFVRGTVVFQGEPKPGPPDVERTTITLLTVQSPVSSFLPGRVGAGGTFSAGPYPVGRYLVWATGPAGWVMTSARWRGQDVALMPFDLMGDDVDDLEVTLSRGAVSAVGRVTVHEKASLERTLVVLFPLGYRSEPALTMNNRRRQSSRVDGSGEYQFSNVPPGDYYLAAIDGGIGNAWVAEDQLDRIAGSAVKVTIKPGVVVRTELRWSGSR